MLVGHVAGMVLVRGVLAVGFVTVFGRDAAGCGVEVVVGCERGCGCGGGSGGRGASIAEGLGRWVFGFELVADNGCEGRSRSWYIGIRRLWVSMSGVSTAAGSESESGAAVAADFASESHSAPDSERTRLALQAAGTVSVSASGLEWTYAAP